MTLKKEIQKQFDFKPIAYPHGVSKENGEMYAVFKYFISIKPKNNQKTKKLITDNKEQKGDLIKIFFEIIECELNKCFINIEFDDEKSYPLKGKTDCNKSTSTSGLTTRIWSEAKMSSDSFNLITDDNEDVKIQQIKDDEYDSILKKSKEYAESENKNGSYKNNGEINFSSLYSKFLEEPVVAERYGLIKSIKIKFNKLLSEGYYDSRKYILNVEDNVSDSAKSIPPPPIKFYYEIFKNEENKYYNGYIRKYLDYKDDFEKVEITYFDKYKKQLSGDKIENDGIYINTTYKTKVEGENIKLDDPFKNNNIFGFNVLVSNDKNKYKSLSITRKKYIYNDRELTDETITSDYLLPNTTIQTGENEEYLPSLLVAWKGENLGLNRIVVNNIDEEADNFDETPALKYNDDDKLNDIIGEYFTKEESFVKGTNLQLISGEKYDFTIRTVTPFNYYLETEEEIELRTGIKDYPEEIFTFEDLAKKPSKRLIFDSCTFPKFKVDAPIIISKESYENENTPYVDSKNSMVVNLLKGESSEMRYLYPPRITWEKFKHLGFLTKEKINNDDINLFVKRCVELEKRALKEIRKHQSLNKKIYYLADPRAKEITVSPNDLFTAQYFHCNEDNIIKNKKVYVFSLKETYPYYDKAKGVKIEARKTASTNNLIIDNKILINKIPLGAFSILFHPDTWGIEKIGEPLNFAFIDKPSVPEFTGQFLTAFNGLNKTVSRFNYNNQSKWRLDYSLKEANNYATKSIKFYEQTEILNLNNENLISLKRNNSKRDLLKDEYPVDFFVQKVGSLEENLQTKSYPKIIKLRIRLCDDLLRIKEKYKVGLWCVLKQKASGKYITHWETNYDKSQYDFEISCPSIKEAEKYIKEKSGQVTETVVQEIFRIKLNEKDTLIVKLNNDEDNFELLYNSFVTKFKKNDEKGTFRILDIDIIYDTELEKYKLYHKDFIFEDIKEKEKTISEYCVLEELINPEISIRDINVAEKINHFEDPNTKIEVNGLQYLSHYYYFNRIHLVREPNEIILKDEGHPFYRKKRIRLFASSSFQGYFPDKTFESEIGTNGDKEGELDLVIPNNTIPEVPEIDTDLLLYNHQQKSWVSDNQISEERSFLVRVTLNQSFMREGDKNKFAIILGKYVDSSCTEFEKTDTEDFSAIGEDITRMIKKETLVTNNIDEFIDTEPSRKELKKYFNNSENTSPKNDLENLHSLGKKNIHFKGSYYKILVCQPYYNVKLKKWQIILSFKNPEETNNIPNKTIDSFFVKLLGFKISYGNGVTYNDDGYFEISNDEKENTSISSLIKPQIIPVYNKKRFTLKRTQEKSKLKVVNENYREGERKIYLISKLKKRTNNNLFFENNIFDDCEIFCTSTSKEFDNNYKEVIVLEFEKHNNYNENTKLSKSSKLPIKGLRLINYVQFKI